VTTPARERDAGNTHDQKCFAETEHETFAASLRP